MSLCFFTRLCVFYAAPGWYAEAILPETGGLLIGGGRQIGRSAEVERSPKSTATSRTTVLGGKELNEAAHRIELDNNPFIPPEQKDPNFGLPQIIVNQGQDQELDGIQCVDEMNGPCCASWSFNTDTWLTDRFDWEVGTENQTHTCFTRIRTEERVQFLSALYQLQWNGDYTDSWQRNQISSGYAAALSSITRSFYAAYKKGFSIQ